MKKPALTVLFFAMAVVAFGQPLTHITIDSTRQKWGDWEQPEWLRYFGADHGDINGDGLPDIAAGRYVYLNPGGTLEAPWQRVVLDDNVDVIFVTDIDGDPFADLIAQHLPEIYWYEALDESGTMFRRTLIGEVPATSHVNSQGFKKASIFGGNKPELLIAGNGDVYALQIPDDPKKPWPVLKVAANTSDEGIGIGDVNGDNSPDIVTGRRRAGEEEPKVLVWFRNAGKQPEWDAQEIGSTEHPIDRVEVADLDGDGDQDVVITEERYPGLEPDAHLIWFENPGQGKGQWPSHIITTAYSLNNLDIADLDGDGDADLVTSEHKGVELELMWWLNDGQGTFTKKVMGTGHENHLGTQLADLDLDGDLDVYGAAWDAYQNMHVWRNDSKPGLRPNQRIKSHGWIPQSSDEGVFLRVGGKYDYRVANEHMNADGWITLAENIDLKNADGAELIVERVQSHDGTKGLAIQLEGFDPLSIPPPKTIPQAAEQYMFHDNARLTIPLEMLKSGDLRARFLVADEHPWDWPQNLIYGTTLRVYYKESVPVFTVKAVVEINKEMKLTLAGNQSENIEEVTFIGLYEDVDQDGDGVYRDWQYHYDRAELKGTLGKASQPPYQINWKLDWVPNQELPVQVMALVTLTNGKTVTTGATTVELPAERPEVRLGKPYNVPANWVTRNDTYTENLCMADTSGLVSSRLFWKSWSPCYDAGILLNGKELEVENTGPCYDEQWHKLNVRKNYWIEGENTLTTRKTPLHDGSMVHGMEVQWPGIMAKWKHNRPGERVSIASSTYEGRPHFVIKTAQLTYYLDQASGGLSRMIDAAGNDWLGFHVDSKEAYPKSAATSYRGFPNLVFTTADKGAGHPGFDRCTSEVTGPNQITVESKSGRWKWVYDFKPDHVLLDVVKTDPNANYWVLYEGVPGGSFKPANYTFGHSKATSSQADLPDFYKGKTLSDQYAWMYCSENESSQTVYMAQVQNDKKPDVIGFLGDSDEGLKSTNGMTVFGFGRDLKTQPKLKGPEKFILGIYSRSINKPEDHQHLAQYLNLLIDDYENP
ncbi:FG-GAP repeat domain-containing protein [Marinoscillum furvescens]|uniref:VCBS repeat protein n=1 Tax=Marinoscillum furvescens DSM 4134 TaxID=1122208 RepID=A0A3D9KX54_MARFU|nr:VCBS repeat-containing protein [Marinoscillum furvescens]RED92024.1 VCBS repeat protein [Marinoscillum furvescens DSM 4134]